MPQHTPDQGPLGHTSEYPKQAGRAEETHNRTASRPRSMCACPVAASFIQSWTCAHAHTPPTRSVKGTHLRLGSAPHRHLHFPLLYKQTTEPSPLHTPHAAIHPDPGTRTPPTCTTSCRRCRVARRYGSYSNDLCNDIGDAMWRGSRVCVVARAGAPAPHGDRCVVCAFSRNRVFAIYVKTIMLVRRGRN